MRNPLPAAQVVALRAIYEGEVGVTQSPAHRALKRRGYISMSGTKLGATWSITEAGQIVLAAHEMAGEAA